MMLKQRRKTVQIRLISLFVTGIFLIGVSTISIPDSHARSLWRSHHADRPQHDATTQQSWTQVVAPGSPMKRVSPRIYKQIPVGVRNKLNGLNCLIPVSFNGVKNVISGYFFNSNLLVWAVVCSRSEQSSILVFKDDSGDNYEELGRYDESNWLITINGFNYFRREISPVNKEYIVTHYQAYGGPQPPVIDHQGVEDGYADVSSSIYYFSNGQWLQLQGAD